MRGHLVRGFRLRTVVPALAIGLAPACGAYAPVPKPKEEATDPHAPKANDSEPVGDWRQRMGREEARAIYKDRAATAECVNAQARNRGLLRLPVRGRDKVKCVATLFALAHNLMRVAVLAPALVGLGTGTSVVAAGAG